MNRFFTAIVILLLWNYVAYADLAVVVNPHNATKKMSKRQITDLFMGSYNAFPDGTTALTIDQPIHSNIRTKFYHYFTGKTASQISAYWAKLIFSGQATPPRPAPDSNAVLKIVSENKSAISYMDSSQITSEVKVIYTFKE